MTMPPPPESVLCVYAHPDDETAVGGILGRLKEAGVPVFAVYLTRGEGSPTNHVDPGGNDPAKAVGVLRPHELQGAATYHGFKRLEILGQPDAGYTTDPAEFLKKGLWDFAAIDRGITAMAAEARPTVVLTMLPRHGGTHAHHQLAAREAIKLFAQGALGDRVQGIYGEPEIDWDEPGAFAVEEQLGLHFPRTTRSAKTGLTWSEYQARGAAFHQTQDTGHRVFTSDEVLLPLWERPGATSIVRRLAP
jgi:LmbE family N-acetylglucosaminyl deacetylase